MIQKAGRCRISGESGQGLVEYALIIAVLVVAILVTFSLGFAAKVLDIYQYILAKASVIF
ncbi:hypothetical protein SAMN02745823_03194 [Sporobacter termitidis DSM 10068]|uniref:Pilus assembly protein Flp/PilA n=1 Tax=Sporobacter termitidis DSM 10068 TaxID=1123282 RepID=A0A1M5Z3Z4_9FIRM|nr:hypothetical protein [Sporobacter termitidis]SHI18987.1 hypothetical protein SAMN02745823_03194 [Sporobacter termitidis DSM 10068]